MEGIVRVAGRREVEPLFAGMAADGLDVLPDEGTWLGAFDAAGALRGAARVFERDGHTAVDDVWVEPAARRCGYATALLEEATRRSPVVWLICDEPDVAFYAGRGFARVARREFPPPLAEHYAAKNEWPSSPDHDHVAMRRG